MNRCVKCLKPDTLPGVEFVDGVCPACIRYENRKLINYPIRRDFLKKLCDEHRSTDGSYDCIIPVSGGKDSYFQVHVMKNVYGMNPLLVCVTDAYTHTQAGVHNFENIGRAFGCDKITLALDPDLVSSSSVETFNAIGSTNWAIDKAIYAWPLQVAVEKNIKLVVYGENVPWEYGGVHAVDTYDANGQIFNDVVKAAGEDILAKYAGRTNALKHPSVATMKAAGIQSIYMSYFYPWNDLNNIEIAAQHGFRTLDGEWEREGFIDSYAHIDSVGYLFNYYLKFMKYGVGRVVDIGSRWVRYGMMTKEELAKEIAAKEGRLDRAIFQDFCNATNLRKDIAKTIMIRWWNTDIFNLDENGEWSWK
jgi:N-acetyl sugar amidotransferase